MHQPLARITCVRASEDHGIEEGREEQPALRFLNSERGAFSQWPRERRPKEVSQPLSKTARPAMNLGIVTVLSLCSGLSCGASYYDQTALSPLEDLDDYPEEASSPQCCPKKPKLIELGSNGNEFAPCGNVSQLRGLEFGCSANYTIFVGKIPRYISNRYLLKYIVGLNPPRFVRPKISHISPSQTVSPHCRMFFSGKMMSEAAPL